MDLLSLPLILRPLQSVPTGKPPPLWWGRAAHALLLRAVAQYNPALAENLHEAPQSAEPGSAPVENVTRPFTVSSLIGRMRQGAPDPQQSYLLRLTGLNAVVSEALAQAAQNGPLAPGALVELDQLHFQVLDPAETEEREEQQDWFAAGGYSELSAPYLLAHQPAPRRLSLRFLSPTTFRSGGKNIPIPLPELVFGSLLDRWNAFAPIAFPAEVRRYAAECLAISRYQLSSRSVPGKSGSLRMGGVGEATYTSLNYDRYWMSVLAALAEFALFSGVGSGTTTGLGQCCRLVENGD